MEKTAQREGVVVEPRDRLSTGQARLIDATSRELLEDPGLVCYHGPAAELLAGAGARVTAEAGHSRVRIPPRLVEKALETVPSKIVLGARKPENRLVLDALEPRVRFGSGSETNTWLETSFEKGGPVFTRKDGSMELLARSAHLCENLENLDFFIRNVNIRDPEITSKNKDVNKLAVSLNNLTRHVQAGLTDIEALDAVVALGQIVAGGADSFAREPVFSFITCIVKSPLQLVDDTTATFLELARRRLPVVVSSCPMGGATGPFDEFAMVTMVNAEVLAGITLHQLAAPGAPVFYGAVPVRTRLDNLNDMYGAPEFNHYTAGCARMARFYRVPCYSTAGVADAAVPGIQATAEKMLTLAAVPQAGPQYVHYAFGLLDRTNTFSPEQAILDDAQTGLVKASLARPEVGAGRQPEVLETIREVMETDHRTFMYHLPLPTRDRVYVRYPFEDREHGALRAASRRLAEIEALPRAELDDRTRREIARHVPGILPRALLPGAAG